MSGSKQDDSPAFAILIGIGLVTVFGLLTWLQVARIAEESYWVIFRVWFIPVPAVLLTGLGTVGGLAVILQGLASWFRR